MGEIIEVIYENGVFKPLKKVRLREGEFVKIEIKETKKVTKRFFKKLAELEERIEKVEGAYRVLEELRNARY
ncbi:MAG: antitoxin family protein [Candidatus Freyarchaeota archaeon]|nr:antitoxin family protein [Candidatus Jordarchaeia archaeon]MBS7269201.1 antitoxin family protein [Candidatus Jordarchaeia archaeon]